VAAASQYLVNVSTSGIHNFKVECGAMPTYGMSKNSGTLLLQQVAKDVSPDRMQVNSFHPGSIFTEASVGGGYTPENLDADDGMLPVSSLPCSRCSSVPGNLDKRREQC